MGCAFCWRQPRHTPRKTSKEQAFFFLLSGKELCFELIPTSSLLLMSASALFIGVETWVLLLFSSPQQVSAPSESPCCHLQTGGHHLP